MSKICYNCFKEITGNGACPHCGYNAAKDAGKYPLALKSGSILNGRYVVGRVLGQGGFGITYVCSDHKTGERLAMKEYLPKEFAGRMKDGASVEMFSGERGEKFEYGKEQFLSEAKTLAEFIGNEQIVRIRSYFEENGTAYFTMEYVEGESLNKYMSTHGGKLTPGEAADLLLPVMDALGWVHSKGIVHRDIAPDNIIVTGDGTAKLIDFGAARFSMGEKSRSLDVILKHGFAPKEQYTRHGRQGAFTDVYAMTATYYYAITGKIPPDAIERTGEDMLKSPAEYGVTISRSLDEALKKGLAISAQNRYGTMAELRSAIKDAMDDSDMETTIQPEQEPEENTIVSEFQTQTDDSNVPKSTGVMGVDITFTQKEVAPETVHHHNAEDEKKTKVKKLVPIAAAVAVAAIAAVILITSGGKKQQNTESISMSSESTDIADTAVTETMGGETLDDIKAGAEKGDPEYLYRLGYIYDNGYDPKDEKCQKQLISWQDRDTNKARECYSKAADKGNADAMYNLGGIYDSLMKYEDALSMYSKAAELGQTDAMYSTAKMYDKGTDVEKDSEKADKWYNRCRETLEAKEDKTVGDLTTLGNIYYNGNGVDKDRTKALEYQNQAVSKLEEYATWYNNIRACEQLGDVYISETYFPTIETDEIKGMEWETKAAEAGDGSALYELGLQYFTGGNLVKDEELGLEYMLRSVENGTKWGLGFLCPSYYFGKLTEEQKERLVDVCKILADAGDPDAMYNLAQIYSNSTYSEQDMERARECFDKAADTYKTEYEKGNLVLISGDTYYTVCCELGEMYNNKWGSKSFGDSEEAALWYERAFDNDCRSVYMAYSVSSLLSETDSEKAIAWAVKGLQYIIENSDFSNASLYKSLMEYTLNPLGYEYSYADNPEQYTKYTSYVEAMKLYNEVMELSQEDDE